tara:strand:+ start:12279 stop:15416 length:3138 start_codon:yes stop_codon:yes gene_type:complete
MSSTSLQNKEVRNTYGDLLLLKGTDNEGLTGGLKNVVDGLYNDIPFQLSNSAVKFTVNPIFTGILADSTSVFSLKNGGGSTKWSFGIDSSAGVLRSESEFSLNVAGTNIFTTSSGATVFVGLVNASLGGFVGPLTGNVTGNTAGVHTGNVIGDVTGNVAGNLTGAVSTAAQGNITSLGTLTGLQVDSVSLDGTTIQTTSGQLNINSATGLISLGDENLTTSGIITGDTLVGTLTTALQTNITRVGTLSALTSTGNIEGDGFTEGGSNTLSNDISGLAATATVASQAVTTLNSDFLLSDENKNFPIAFVNHDIDATVNSAYTKRFSVDDGDYLKYNPSAGRLTLSKSSTISISALGEIHADKIKLTGNIIEDEDGVDMITFDSSGNSTLAGTTTGTFSGNGSALTNLSIPATFALTEATGTNLTLDYSGNVEIEHGTDNKFTITEGADSNLEYLLTNYDGGYTNFILYENGGATHDDYFKIATTAAGATIISTVDDNAALGHLDFNIDGDIEFKSAGNVEVKTDGLFRYKSYDGSSTYMTFGITSGIGTANGIGLSGSASNMTLSNNEIDIASGNFTLDVDTNISLDTGNENTLYFKHAGVIYAELIPATVSTFKIYGDGASTSSDYLSIATTTTGRTSITTVDAAGADAHISFKPDGDLTFSTDVGDVKMTNEDFIFENTLTDATAEGLIFKKIPAGENCSSSDKIGQLQFKGKNTNGDIHDFSYIYGMVGSSTDGNEWGKIIFQTAQQSDGALYSSLMVGTDQGRGIQVGTNVDAGGNIICGAGNVTISNTALTVDSGDFTFNVDGNIELNADDGEIVFKDDTETYASIYNRGFRIHQGGLYIDEGTGSPTIDAVGHLWVKNDAPNNLYFTDDTGQNTQITSNGVIANQKWANTCGGYKTNNNSATNYIFQYYPNYYFWGNSDSSPTTITYGDAYAYQFCAPANGILTNIRVTLRGYDTGTTDPVKFYVYKGVPGNDVTSTSLTLLATTGTITPVAFRQMYLSTDISSSNTFSAGDKLYVMYKKDSTSGNQDLYFSVSMSGVYT